MKFTKDAIAKILSYIQELVKIQNLLLAYIDGEGDEEQDFQDLTKYIEESKILEDKNKIKSFFHLLSCIFNEHHRKESFLRKIDTITNLYKTQLFNHFSQEIIFNLFRQNKRFALSIFGDPNNSECLDQDLIHKLHFSNDKKDTNELFEKKIRNGENDFILCKSLRDDQIETFSELRNRLNTNINKFVPPSQFESHNFLNENNLRQIEYATFFGSLQIFKHFQYNEAKLESQLWLSVVHGRNYEFFHAIQELNINLPNGGYPIVAAEAIKCHHTELLNYIVENLIENPESAQNNQLFLEKAFEFYNFEIIEQQLQVESIVISNSLLNILLSCDYYYIIKLLKDLKLFDVNQVLRVLIYFFVLMKIEMKKLRLCI